AVHPARRRGRGDPRRPLGRVAENRVRHPSRPSAGRRRQPRRRHLTAPNEVVMNDTTIAQKPALKASGAFYVETVTWVQHWTPELFSFRTTRDPGLRFSSGQFVMVGLMTEEGRPLVRAYSIASPAWNDELVFYSIK